MKRKAFVLTEILTGMMLQTIFALTLCGAFYMILTFGTSTQQILAAHDEGQMVISYIDSRIRNAGLGLWDFDTSSNRVAVAEAFQNLRNAFLIDTTDYLPLPVAITHSTNPANYNEDKVSSDENGLYRGNVLTLLYAHKDTKRDTLIVTTNDEQSNIEVNSSGENFSLIDKNNTGNTLTNSNFDSGKNGSIKCYAVTETSGRPVFLSGRNTTSQTFSSTDTETKVTIYPLSELLNLECQKMYTKKDTNGNNFVFADLIEDGGAKWKSYYHTKGILELYMTLDTNANPPIFDLKVLVSEGKSDEVTAKPNNWPAAYWYETATTEHDDFRTHRVHVSQASWKLYNLAPLYHND